MYLVRMESIRRVPAGSRNAAVLDAPAGDSPAGGTRAGGTDDRPPAPGRQRAGQKRRSDWILLALLALIPAAGLAFLAVTLLSGAGAAGGCGGG
ncbi:MAG: hypothetical protein ACLQI7_28270 [Streptosporangiaceae bacterium]|jgi:hypothetical protein